MKFKVTHSASGPKKLRAELHKRARAAATVAGRAVSEGLRDEVVKRIPRGEPWLDIYRSAIQYLESSTRDEWAVAGLSRTKLTTVPAESTQIKVMGDTTVALILKQHNPWTVDTLPPVSGGISADAEVRPASRSEIEAHRVRLGGVLDAVRDKLTAAGAQLTGTFPEIAGTVFVDLVFLQMRLEHGLGGFPRVPHWVPAARQAANKSRNWVNSRSSEIRAVLAGKEVQRSELEMPRALARRLADRRDETWL